MVSVKSDGHVFDDGTRVVGPGPGARTRSTSVSPLAGHPDGPLPRALEILAAQMHKAIAERRDAPPGSEPYRRADELVAYLNELYVRLQRRMEVPAEIWLLSGGRAPERSLRSRRRHSR